MLVACKSGTNAVYDMKYSGAQLNNGTVIYHYGKVTRCFKKKWLRYTPIDLLASMNTYHSLHADL